ncbi:ArnT family glycosyltransferase [Actinacidiphila bryophytorum]|uniref:Integral membrane protein n=1 Tax=Actinacidiphila bryophytorum TaxID=1436133 RepID=A0A9W4H4Z3_9ACTN|nr:glycosyltransferase family 39 protein [Actinacidiphila bryophytorum]MBM9435672.1 glycosyltransferase family 39 protein [Actinacidiphila bryophytorum]MBN6546643.1 glycosyltransferase family 39 protein [Actinacidiphila bryophytorum]CAG7650787.1 putative integral membrane protein [Actinacidiphila bryophytorum]
MTALTHPPTAPAASLGRRTWRGRPDDPAWARPALLALLLGTLVLYLYDLGASGYANSFYSAAVQAGSQSWKAFFFGSSDAANSITVDKPPAALWPMALSVRLFGLGSWQILVPEALMGVGTVALLYASVRRRFGAAAGLVAGAALAVTPVAALMFRFNNPDALLALLMVATIYSVQRALEDARTRWLLAAGALLGLAFLTKTLQAWLIVPVLTAVYAVCAPTRLRRRLLQLLYAGGAMLLAGGWWVAVVELWPASSRPYIGGSQDNSFLGLTFGYNGFGRITGNETGSVGGGGGPGGGGGGMWGATGIGRLFNSDMGGQIAWLLPAAFALLLAGLWFTRRAPRTDQERAAFLLWGGSLLATFVTFSFMSGIFHQYYNIALAPYIAAVTAMGAVLLWRRRRSPLAAAVLAATAAGTGAISYVLLDRSPSWHPWLRYAVLAVGIAAAVALPAAPYVRFAALARTAAVLGLAAALGGPVAYTLDTVATPHQGSIVTAGPAVASGGFPGGGGRPNGGPPTGTFPGAPGGRGAGQGFGQPGRQAPPQGRGGGGGMGGLLDGAQVSAEMTALLKADAGRYTWVAAAVGSQNQASYQLASGEPVMSVGGFNGSDPSPTLVQFKRYVAAGRIHYFIASGGGGMGGGMGAQMGGSRAASEIASWVAATYPAKTVGSTTVYDLS